MNGINKEPDYWKVHQACVDLCEFTTEDVARRTGIESRISVVQRLNIERRVGTIELLKTVGKIHFYKITPMGLMIDLEKFKMKRLEVIKKKRAMAVKRKKVRKVVKRKVDSVKITRKSEGYCMKGYSKTHIMKAWDVSEVLDGMSETDLDKVFNLVRKFWKGKIFK